MRRKFRNLLVNDVVITGKTTVQATPFGAKIKFPTYTTNDVSNRDSNYYILFCYQQILSPTSIQPFKCYLLKF